MVACVLEEVPGQSNQVVAAATYRGPGDLGGVQVPHETGAQPSGLLEDDIVEIDKVVGWRVLFLAGQEEQVPDQSLHPVAVASKVCGRLQPVGADGVSLCHFELSTERGERALQLMG